jgi:hypothetical protein
VKRFLVALALAACGDNQIPPIEPVVDAPPDSPNFPAGCDWAEQSDVTNDFTISNFTSEATHLVLAKSATICARIDNNHYDTLGGTVDVDGFELTLDAPAQVLVTFVGPAEALTSVEVEVLESDKTLLDRGAFLGSHAAFRTALIPGTYQLGVIAKNPADIDAAFDYKLRVVVDPPDTRCPALTATAAYVETNDGPQNNRNDVLEVRYAPDERVLTAANNDDPEDTGLTTAAETNLRITGTSADVDPADDFRDRDTYLVTTGAHDQLTVRVDWTGDADFDFLLLPEGATTEIASSATISKTAPELATFPVLPNTRYWLWVGSFDSSVGLPIDYSITLCPTQTAP